MLELLIANSLIVDGTGNLSVYGAVGVEGERLAPPARQPRRCLDAAQVLFRRPRPGGILRFHRHARPLRAGDPRRAGPPAQGAPGCDHGGDRDRRLFLRPVRLRGGLRDQFVRDQRRPRRLATPAGRSAHGRAVPRLASPSASRSTWSTWSANSPLRIGTVGWANQPPTASRAGPAQRALLRTALRGEHLGDVDGLGPPPGSYADAAEGVDLSRRGGAAGWDVPHPRPLQPRRPLPRPLPRGARDQGTGQGIRHPHHPLLPAHDGAGWRPR